MKQDQNKDELHETNEASVSAAAVGYGLLGVAIGVIVGAAVVVGVFYLVRLLVQ